MTADVDQQRRVVHAAARLLVQAHPLREPQRDQALAQHVLHRLPEAQVDAERQRRDEFSQPDVRAIGTAAHEPTLLPNGQWRRGESNPYLSLAKAACSRYHYAPFG